eukprot:scaffold2109_cov123-Isochrysis_galbana.AAC.10
MAASDVGPDICLRQEGIPVGVLLCEPRHMQQVVVALDSVSWRKKSVKIQAIKGQLAVAVLPAAAAALEKKCLAAGSRADPSADDAQPGKRDARLVPEELRQLLLGGGVRWCPGVRNGARAALDQARAPVSGPAVSSPAGEYSFTFAELFAGIGGFRLALESLGGQCVFSSEVEEHAIATYAANFRAARPAGDISEIPSEAVPEHDLLCGGFPCQAFSIAGPQRGLAQDQLFLEVLRIAATKQPRALLFENVPNLISIDGGHNLHLIAAGLCRAGYVVRVGIVNAAAFVPQQRERLFLVGLRADLSEAIAAFEWPAMPDPPPPPLRYLLEPDGAFDGEKYALTDAQWAGVRRSHAFRRGGATWRLAQLDGYARTLRSSYRSSYQLYSEFVLFEPRTAEQRSVLARVLAQDPPPPDSDARAPAAISGNGTLISELVTAAAGEPGSADSHVLAERQAGVPADRWLVTQGEIATSGAAATGRPAVPRQNEEDMRTQTTVSDSGKEEAESSMMHSSTAARPAGTARVGPAARAIATDSGAACTAGTAARLLSDATAASLVDPMGQSESVTAAANAAARALGVWPRFYTERECLRLQGFPDDFELRGKGRPYGQICNAVCPPVARAISRQILLALGAQDGSGQVNSTGKVSDPLGSGSASECGSWPGATAGSGPARTRGSDSRPGPAPCDTASRARSCESALTIVSLELLDGVSPPPSAAGEPRGGAHQALVERVASRPAHRLYCSRCDCCYSLSGMAQNGTSSKRSRPESVELGPSPT